MAAKARQQYYADWEYIDKQAREFQPTMEFKTKIDSIEPGAQVNIIEDIKVNWTSLEVDDKTVDISIPLVIDNLYSTDWANALSAKQGKVLYDLVQNLASRGRYLSNWNAATWLPTTNPVESHYQYRAWDYYVVSNVAAQWGTNYRPEPGEFVIWQASITVETEVVKVTDMYLYDGSNWNLLINSTREIAIDSSLSTSSTNPVENRVVTNAINGKQDTLVAWSNIQIASDWKTISATDTTYTAGTNVSIDANNQISAVDTTYTAWANVQISNQNVISATDTVYSAGTNVQINNNVISATDTTYSAWYGICIDNNNEISSTWPRTYCWECDPISEYCACPSKFNWIQEWDYYESECAWIYQYRWCNIDCECYSDWAWEKIEKYALFDYWTTNTDSYDCKYILWVEWCWNSAYSCWPYVRRDCQWKTISWGSSSEDDAWCLCWFTWDTHYMIGQSCEDSWLYIYGTSWYWLDRLDKDSNYRCWWCCKDTLDYIRWKSECPGCPSDWDRYLAYWYVWCEYDVNDVWIGFYNWNYRCWAWTEICIINNWCSSSWTKTPIARIWKGCQLDSDQYDDVLSWDLWWNQDCSKLKVYDYNCWDFVDVWKTYSEWCGVCIDNDEISTKIGCWLTYGSSDEIEVSGCDVASMISWNTVSSVNGCLEIDQWAATCLLAWDWLYANPSTCMIDIDTTCVATQSDLSCKQDTLNYYKECNWEAYIYNDNWNCLHSAIITWCWWSFSVTNWTYGDTFLNISTDSSWCYSYWCLWEDVGDTYIKWDDITIWASQWCYLSYSQSDGMLDFSYSCWLKSWNENYTLNANASTDIARKSDLSWKQDKATSGSTAPSTTPSYVWQQYIDTTADKMYVATGTSSSSDWTEVGAWSWDMLYSDFNWVTKTWATITLDLRSEITPSTDFTVNKPSTLEDWQYYILRVTSWATAYTMTLWTNVTNPYSEDLTLEASTVQQFTFLAKGWNLELQPSSAGVVYTAWTWITISNDEISADTTVLATKTDLNDLNTKTFYLSNINDLTTATAALQWHFAGKNAIIVYSWYAYTIWTSSSSSPLVFISTIARSPGTSLTKNWIKNLQIFFDSSHNATVIHDSTKLNEQGFLETDYNYSTPYTPTYAGSPATKKYVDDNVVQKSATAPASPVEWMVWYDTTNDVLKVYDWTDWNEVWSWWAWDMLYQDFNWVTKTWATVTLDFNSVIEPSANFTVNAPSTIKDWQIYILRVESGATAYTMTLGTWITNPYSESITLTANKIKLFTFLAIDGDLELQPSISPVDISGKQDKATSWTSAPATTPSYIWQEYIKTNDKKLYIATGTTSSTDWTLVWWDIQLAPNSPLTPKYLWYWTQAQYDALSQYYTDEANDTVYFTI